MLDFPVVVQERDVYMLPYFQHTHILYTFYIIRPVQHVCILEPTLPDDEFQEVRFFVMRCKDASDTL